jgi:serine/threonine-protein phosphatase 2A regulatory subunit B''
MNRRLIPSSRSVSCLGHKRLLFQLFFAPRFPISLAPRLGDSRSSPHRFDRHQHKKPPPFRNFFTFANPQMATATTSWEVAANQFFTDWLTDPSTGPIFTAIQYAADVLNSGGAVDFDLSVFEAAILDPHATVRIRPPTLTSSASHIHLSTSFVPVGSLDSAAVPIADTDTTIPTFYGPVANEIEKEKVESLAQSGLALDKIEELFDTYCRLPSCFASVFLASRPFRPGTFVSFWNENILGRSPNDRLFCIVAGPSRTSVSPTDLTPFVNAIALTHESLQFLQDGQAFFVHYVDFVVTRLFFMLDPELRGSADIYQFRQADLAGRLFSIYHLADVNEPTSLFCYQHFYVTFCKFWDLDGDADGVISKDDLMKFNESAVSPIICDRFVTFSFAPRAFTGSPVIDFRSFAYFLMATEDKTSLTAINLWFRLCDLDDDGVLSIQEIGDLYAQQFERMGMTGNETIPFDDILRQLIDAVRPANPMFVTIRDLIASKQAELFFTTLTDLQKFLVREYQAPILDPETEELAKRLSPFDIYVLTQYAQLVNESG